MKKLCSDCGDDLDYPEESKRNICNTCNCIRAVAWQRNNKPKVAAKARRHSLKKYGLTEEVYKEMFNLQGGVCKICKKTNVSNKKLTIDHCHTSKSVRGLLCVKCNSMLGLAGDNVNILKTAILYLKNKGNI